MSCQHEDTEIDTIEVEYNDDRPADVQYIKRCVNCGKEIDED